MTDNDAAESDPPGGEGAPSDAVEVRGPAPPAVAAEATGVVEQFMAGSMAVMGGAINPLADRITSEHITDAINFMENESRRAAEDARHSRWMTFALILFLVIAGMAFVVVMVSLDETDLVRDIIPIAAALGVGFLGGFGFGRTRGGG